MKSTQKKHDKIVNLKSESDFDSEVLNSKEPVIVDFYADWCGPCKKLGPILEKACLDENTFKLVKINVDESRELSDRYKVSGIPFVLLFHNGQKQTQFSGFSMDELKKMLELCKNLRIGYTLDPSYNKKDESALGQDMSGIFEDLLSTLPSEPSQNENDVYIINFKFGDLTFTRRFRGNEKIETLILFVKVNLKTLNEIELFENFPRKIYNNQNLLINKSGLSKNQILYVKMI